VLIQLSVASMRGVANLRRFQRREALIAATCVLVFALLLCSLLTFELVRTRRNVIQTGYIRASNLVLVMEEQTRRTVQTLDFALTRIASELSAAPDTPSHYPEFTARLREELVKLPYVRALFVIGRDGHIIQDTDAGTPDVSLADRAYFKSHLGDSRTELFIGAPLKSRSTQIGSPWFLSVSKAVRLPGGALYGVVAAAVEPKYFDHFYSELNVGEGGVIGLVHRSGLVIARYPVHTIGTGSSRADQKLFQVELKKAPAGVYSDVSKADGVDRLYAYRTVSPSPLVVSVGLSRHTLLADWRRQAIVSCAAGATLLLVVVAGIFIVLRHRARDLAVAEHLHNIERLEAVGRIASTVAHDFNNLLSVIGGNIEIAAAKLPADNPSQTRLSTALEAVRQGGRMAKDLLTFARHGSAAAKTEDLCAMLTQDSDLLRQAARPCQLKLIISEQSCPVVIDRNGFERALMNLVVNARDATKGAGEITITTRLQSVDAADRKKWPDLAPGQYVACSVQDRGEGIPPQLRSRVFDPFFTTKPDGVGTGLGLSQVFGLARQSGGGAYIDSKVGVGTTVTLMLPSASPRRRSHSRTDGEMQMPRS
jgi:signal transduction histidine kinase